MPRHGAGRLMPFLVPTAFWGLSRKGVGFYDVCGVAVAAVKRSRHADVRIIVGCPMQRILTAGLLVLSSAAFAAADSVPLRVNLVAGQSWKFDSTQTTEAKNKATLNGQSQPFATKSRQHRAGTITVLTVVGGVPTSVRVIFDKDCDTTQEANGNSQTQTNPYAGQTVTLTRAADGSVKDDFPGRADPDSAAELRGMLDADTVVMPPHSVNPGDEWPGDPAAVARVLQLSGQDRGGMTMKLLSVKTIDGKPMAEVKVSFVVQKAPANGMSGKIVAQGTELVDLATGHGTRLDVSGNAAVSGKQQGPGPDGRPATFDITGQGTIVMAATSPFVDGGSGPVAAANPPVPGGGVNPLAPAAPTFAGTFSDDKLKVELKPAANGYDGTMTLNGQAYPAAASVKDGAMDGQFTAGANAFPFTATLDGDTLTLVSGGVAYQLKRAAVNPLGAGGGPANPLAPHSDASPTPRNAGRSAVAGYVEPSDPGTSDQGPYR